MEHCWLYQEALDVGFIKPTSRGILQGKFTVYLSNSIQSFYRLSSFSYLYLSAQSNHSQFYDKPWQIWTSEGYQVVLPPAHVDELKMLQDDTFPSALREVSDLHTAYGNGIPLRFGTHPFLDSC